MMTPASMQHLAVYRPLAQGTSTRSVADVQLSYHALPRGLRGGNHLERPLRVAIRQKPTSAVLALRLKLLDALIPSAKCAATWCTECGMGTATRSSRSLARDTRTQGDSRPKVTVERQFGTAC
jgi:hypothetical protein